VIVKQEFFMKRMFPLGALALAMMAVSAAPGAAQDGGMRGEGMDRMFEQFDTDGDGRITKEEIATARAARMAAIDADGDGIVTREEMIAGHSAMAAERATKRAGEMFDRMDADGDGKVTVAEAMTAPRGRGMDAMFDPIDADGDGVITKAEAEAARENMRGMRGGRGDKGDKGDMGARGEHRGEGQGGGHGGGNGGEHGKPGEKPRN